MLELEPYRFNVTTAFDAAKAWHLDPPVDGIPYCTRYDDHTLFECARENRRKVAEWRLVWLYGLSLWEIHLHSSQHGGLGFNDRYPWWRHASERRWMGAKFEPGYYLVDVSGRFRKKTWNCQEDSIGQLGDGFMRAPEAVIAETAFLTAQHTKERGARELLLPSFLHRGPSLDSAEDGVCVGNSHPERGMLIMNSPRKTVGGEADGVCLIRKFDH